MPVGRPRAAASERMISATRSVVIGVSSAGLITTVHPAASAGAILRVAMAMGKFQGVISRRRTHGPAAHVLLVRTRRRRAHQAVGAHRLLGEPAQELGAVEDLGAGLGQGLAGLGGDQRRDVVGAGDAGGRTPRAAAPAFARRHGAPGGGRGVRGVEGPYGVGGRGVGDVEDGLGRRRVGDLERGAVRGGSPVPVDEEAGGQVRHEGGGERRRRHIPSIHARATREGVTSRPRIRSRATTNRVPGPGSYDRGSLCRTPTTRRTT